MIREFYLSGPLSEGKPAYAGQGRLPGALRTLLAQWNGVFAYAGALVILPSGTSRACWTMEELNAGAWRAAYPEATEAWFFAVDAVGHPFGILDDAVVRLDPETGAVARLHEEWDGFLAAVEAEPNRTARLHLFEAWVSTGKTLGLRDRIVPDMPFCEGGGRAISAYHAEDLMLFLDLSARRHARLRTSGEPASGAPSSDAN